MIESTVNASNILGGIGGSLAKPAQKPRRSQSTGVATGVAGAQGISSAGEAISTQTGAIVESMSDAKIKAPVRIAPIFSMDASHSRK